MRILPKCWKWAGFRNQCGMALVSSLIILVVLTLLGLAGMQTSLLEERMAGNFEQRHSAFQAAEAGLRHAETWLENTVVLPAFDNTDGLYLSSSVHSSPRWESVDWADDSQCRTFTGGAEADLSGRYIVEYVTTVDIETSDSEKFGPEPDDKPVMYRISSRGTSSNGIAVVVLQTTYIK